MLKTISAGMTALAVIAGPSLGHAQQGPSAGSATQSATEADLNALTDARVAIIKNTLQLTPDQEKLWSPVEDAIRSRAKGRQKRLEAVTTGLAQRANQSPIEILRDRNPVDFLNRRADALAARSDELKKLAAAWQPLYQSLTSDQKKRLGLLTVIAIRDFRDRAEQLRIRAEEDAED